jgi:Ca-activated chloride channel family protein
MRSLSRILVPALSAAMLLPSAASAQVLIDPPPEPLPRVPCLDSCWFPPGTVAQLDRIEADVEVVDGSVEARYRFELSNPVPDTDFVGGPGAEGRIVFPVPPGSSITDLLLSGGPETLEGSLLDADEATLLYEDIVRRLIDPALLRSLEGDLYEVRAFPVPPGEERQVSFTVTTPLLAEGEEAIVSLPWSRMSPRPASGLVSVDVDVPWGVRSALAPGFELDEERSADGTLELGWESPSGWTPDTDFRLHLSGGEGLLDTRLLAHREDGEDGYFSLLFAPVLEAEAAVARDIVLVIDRSGSMEGEKMQQAIDAASYVLEHLGDDDRFAVVDFSRSVHTFADEPRPAEDADAGLDYVRDLAAGGNTNISGALERAMTFLDGDRPGTVIFLTDGLPTVGIESAEGILELAEDSAPERTQLFAFGVGYDVDTILLDSLARAFVGSSHYVAPEERIDAVVARLYEQVSTPVLSAVSIDIDGVETWDLAPLDVPGIFAGTQVLLTGRYSGDGRATVTVTGDTAEGRDTFTYEVTFPEEAEDDPAIAQLWAQRRVADLLTELRIEGQRDALIEEIVDIATRFGIVTPYTAYLAQEPELALRDEAAADALMQSSAAMAEEPVAGQAAVERAKAVSDLYAGDVNAPAPGGEAVRRLGTHAFYLVEGAWTRDDFEAGTDAPEIEVGTPAFLDLVAEDPDLAEAAALGERVITRGPDGWLTLVWPEVAPTA